MAVDMQQLVSVIITTYKGTDSLRRAIESVLNQTYKAIEVIIVDDNGIGTESQRETEAIVNEFLDKNIDIIYIPHRVNLNGSAARNTGIHAAKGKYIALLDDDDAFKSEKIQKQVDVLESAEGFELCYTGMVIHYSNGKEIIQSQNDSGNIFPEVMMRKIHAPSSVLMFSKEAAVSIGGFDTSFKRHQDWEFVDRMAQKYKIGVVSDPCIDRYICLRNSASNPKQYEKNRLFYLEKMRSYIDELTKSDKQYMYDFHYRSICKEYLKSKDFYNAIRNLLKCRKPLVSIKCIMRDYIRYRKP